MYHSLATASGVWPSPLVTLMSAPLSSSSVAHATRSYSAARCSGVMPILFLWFTSAPTSSSSRVQSMLPCITAYSSGDAPVICADRHMPQMSPPALRPGNPRGLITVVGALMLAPRARSSFITSAWSCSPARCSGFWPYCAQAGSGGRVRGRAGRASQEHYMMNAHRQAWCSRRWRRRPAPRAARPCRPYGTP